MKENFTITTNVPEMPGVKETAEKFCISHHYARQLALSGNVKAVRVGRTFHNLLKTPVSSRYPLSCKVVNI